ncbi:MAG: VanZ family protein [Pseudomonadota bacterium]|nr:VanZ family protein [Pseudomonadota bacterium]
MIRTLWFLAGLVIVAAIIYLSIFMPQVEQAADSQIDKVKHFIAYGTLMLWFSQLYQDKARLHLIWIFIGLGVAIEFIQPLTGREFSILDMLANTAGILIALFIASKGGDFLYPKLQKPE